MTEWHSVTSWGSETPHRLFADEVEAKKRFLNAVAKMHARRVERDNPKILVAEEPVMSALRYEDSDLTTDVDTAYNLVQEAETKKKIKDFQLERERKCFLANRKMLWACLVAMVSMAIMSATISAFFGVAAFFFFAMSAMFTLSGANMINRIDQIKIDQIKIDLEIERATNRFLRLEEEERNYNAGL